MTLYDERDAAELEPHYSRHVSAMASEGLHRKSAIAAELAMRDKRIAELERELAKASEFNCSLELQELRNCERNVGQAIDRIAVDLQQAQTRRKKLASAVLSMRKKLAGDGEDQ